MKVVLRIGGSVLIPAEIDGEVLRVMVREINKVRKEHELFVVVGGGRTARRYIEAARKYESEENSLDLLGILSSRLNALLLVTCVKGAELVENFHEVLHAKKLPVLGGTAPGQTTDTVAALLAELVRADLLVKVTDVDGVYTVDPKIDSTAEKIRKMGFKELEKFSQREFEAGISSVIDPVAAEIISKNRLKVFVIGKRDMEDLARVIKGDHSGTVIG
ncbi:MAG: UMP kinase [Theionarchaea archaeon]|nr:UMP kinase [Theionarchaea archaeon]